MVTDGCKFKMLFFQLCMKVSFSLSLFFTVTICNKKQFQKRISKAIFLFKSFCSIWIYHVMYLFFLLNTGLVILFYSTFLNKEKYKYSFNFIYLICLRQINVIFKNSFKHFFSLKDNFILLKVIFLAFNIFTRSSFCIK